MKVRIRFPWVSQIHPPNPYRVVVRVVAYLFDVRRVLLLLSDLLSGPTAPYFSCDFSLELASAPSCVLFSCSYHVRLSALLFGPTCSYFPYDFSSKLESDHAAPHFADAYRASIDTHADWIFFPSWVCGYASFLRDICVILYLRCTERASPGLPFVPLRRNRILAEVIQNILGLNR